MHGAVAVEPSWQRALSCCSNSPSCFGEPTAAASCPRLLALCQLLHAWPLDPPLLQLSEAVCSDAQCAWTTKVAFADIWDRSTGVSAMLRPHYCICTDPEWCHSTWAEAQQQLSSPNGTPPAGTKLLLVILQAPRTETAMRLARALQAVGSQDFYSARLLLASSTGRSCA